MVPIQACFHLKQYSRLLHLIQTLRVFVDNVFPLCFLWVHLADQLTMTCETGGADK